MKVALFSARDYEVGPLEAANREFGHELTFFPEALGPDTAHRARGHSAVCVAVGDDVHAPALDRLAEAGVRYVALRSAGFDHVDVGYAAKLGIRVCRVPEYSPESISEHSIGLLLALTHRLVEGSSRTRKGRLDLSGLEGRTLAGKVAGVVGTGRIGGRVARTLASLGMQVLACDPVTNVECERAGVRYVQIDELLQQAFAVSLHCPLVPATRHLLDESRLALLPHGAFIVNTSRGSVIDTEALLAALDAGRVAGAALDVYEFERGLFFAPTPEPRLDRDPLFERLVAHPRVIVTAHQAFLTVEALHEIATTTWRNLRQLETGAACANLC